MVQLTQDVHVILTKLVQGQLLAVDFLGRRVRPGHPGRSLPSGYQVDQKTRLTELSLLGRCPMALAAVEVVALGRMLLTRETMGWEKAWRRLG